MYVLSRNDVIKMLCRAVLLQQALQVMMIDVLFLSSKDYIEFDARSREKESMNHIGLGDRFEVL
jgi:hypothetical protein